MKKVISLLVLVVGLVSCEKNQPVEMFEGTYEGVWTEFDTRGGYDTSYTTQIIIERLSEQHYTANTPIGELIFKISNNGNMKWINSQNIVGGINSTVGIEFSSKFGETYIFKEFVGNKL